MVAGTLPATIFIVIKPAGTTIVTLYVNDKKVGEGKVDRTITALFAHESLNVGIDDLTTVADNYKAPFAFNNTLNKVTLQLK